ncbi:hypothetical protein [Rhizobium sp. NLR22b]|uniref:hypothetical protein n=2 Tax=Rhizobium/Agrobacterium group TaxID=227290 RepID=UPI001C8342AA|nr:hypothetical protein [Rhizobium sp. NLR22b]MBX5239407.1 hypothetical protein [Rhizobium sp. NLR22b]
MIRTPATRRQHDRSGMRYVHPGCNDQAHDTKAGPLSRFLDQTLNHIRKEIAGAPLRRVFISQRQMLINNYSNQLMYRIGSGTEFTSKVCLWRF